jgi:deoxycytidylate deaminase
VSYQIAERVARANTSYERWPFGCCIRKGGAVQAIGWNSYKADPFYLDDHRNCSVHAEVAALRQLRYRARGCSMFVVRVMRSGPIGLAYPCANCRTLIIDSGIRRVTYSIDNNNRGVWYPQRED